MNAATAIALIIAILALAGFAFLFWDRRRTSTVRSRFGPEFDRAVRQEGNERRARAILEQRQERVARYPIRPLTLEEQERFVAEWRAIQAHFVDNPCDAIARADRLVSQAMHARGYPTSDFDRQAADLSVDHPHVLGDYRIAHEIALRSEENQASTEDLRLAMQHYRALFEELVEVGAAREEIHR